MNGMRSRQWRYSWCVKTKNRTAQKSTRRAQRKQSQRATKQAYRLRNWKQYNNSLRQRGDLNLWIDEETLKHWRCRETWEKTGRRGAPRLYDDSAILCALTLQALFRLPLRATQGLLTSLFRLMNVDLEAPDYSTLSRRRATLDVVIPSYKTNGPVHLVVDSTGLKVYGEGEWKVRQHGWSKRRTWRKLHLGVNEATGEILAAMATVAGAGDGQMLGDLLEQVDERGLEIRQVSGDGGYDTRQCYDAIRKRGARATIPPRKRARIWKHGNTAQERHIRDENLRAIRKKGRQRWKEESGYHRRSLAETAMFRIKTLFGSELSARKYGGQVTELYVRCAALNRITALGMPVSYPA